MPSTLIAHAVVESQPGAVLRTERFILSAKGQALLRASASMNHPRARPTPSWNLLKWVRPGHGMSGPVA